MLTVSFKSLWGHKRRLLSTVLAVLLGVAFLSGTMVLGDTMRQSLGDFFSDANQGTDAVVRSDIRIDGESDARRGLLDQSLLASVRAVDGVAAAEPSVVGFGQLVSKDGEPIGGNGPPTNAGNWIHHPDLNPYRLAEGRLPRADDEVIIDRRAAKAGDLQVGDRTTLHTPDPVAVTIVGIATFGTADSAGPMTFTAFTLDGVQKHVTEKPGQISSISVAAADGLSQEEVVARLRSVLPQGAEAITGEALTDEQMNDVNRDFLDMFTTFLLVFAGVALLVATFSIYNTFSIIVAQRSRESALLRAIGASQRQILTSTMGEAVAVGVVASVVGLFGGVGIAVALKALLSAFGFGVPATGLVFTGSTAAISLAVGVIVTLVAGAIPAAKACRVPPLAAMRDTAVEPTSASTVRIVAGLLVALVGVGVVLTAVAGSGDGVLPLAGLGALLTIVGVVVFGPTVAGATSRILGAPLPRLRGITGQLARDNAMRNPRRTSGTASALMIGVAVVTLFTVFAASLKASVDDSVQRSFGGDLTINTSGWGAGGFSPQLAADVSGLAEVDEAVGLGRGAARIDGGDANVTVADPAKLDRVLDLDVRQGVLSQLGDQTLAVSKEKADDKGWKLGATVPVSFIDGTATQLTVGAVYEARDVAGDYLLTRNVWAPHALQDVDAVVLVKLREGVSLSAGRAAIEGVAAAYAGAEVQDRQEYAASVTQGVNQMLALVYIMLALAVLIALMGIANTLSLSIHERTREIGLLRAVGLTRGQLRGMVRWESVIIALFGTIGGLGLGLFLGWALVRAASGEGIGTFAAPPAQVVTVLVVGALAGVLAAIRPARKAARLDVLRAIATG